MAELANYADVEAALVTVLSDLATTGTVTPADLQTALPFVRIARRGGSDDRITDTATVDIDAFAASRTDSRLLADTIRARLIAPGGLVSGAGVLIDQSSTATAPNEVPWSNDQSIRRFTATYRVTARRP